MLSWASFPFKVLPSTAMPSTNISKDVGLTDTFGALLRDTPTAAQTSLSSAFAQLNTNVEDILRKAERPFRDLPAVKVALFPPVSGHTLLAHCMTRCLFDRDLYACAPKSSLSKTARNTDNTLRTNHRSDLPAFRPAEAIWCDIALLDVSIVCRNTSLIQQAFVELPTLMGFMTSKIVWGPPPRRLYPGTISRYQPRTLGADHSYCTTRANFANTIMYSV
jgi:hypothetical protein